MTPDSYPAELAVLVVQMVARLREIQHGLVAMGQEPESFEPEIRESIQRMLPVIRDQLAHGSCGLLDGSQAGDGRVSNPGSAQVYNVRVYDGRIIPVSRLAGPNNSCVWPVRN
jgi:hypothetical protein